MDKQVEQLKNWMEESSNTVAVTGAGISYMYGMRRLKNQTGRMDLMRKLSPKYVKSHPEDFYAMMKDAFLDATFEKGPGPVHKQLAELEKRGMLAGIVTQNLDYLHELAGSQNVAEIVGSFADSCCVECGHMVTDIHVWNQGHAPQCPECGGYLMPINFDRNSPDYARLERERMDRAVEMIAQAQLLIVIGTTGFRSEEYLAKLNKSTKLVQINPGSTVFDQMVQLNIRQDAEKVFAQILAEV